MKIVVSEVVCSVCKESKVFDAEFDTDDEKLARKLHAEQLKSEILDFYTSHSSHEIEYRPVLKPNGEGREAQIRAAAAWCNWHLENSHAKETLAS